MEHDYTELMSAALDDDLEPHERTTLTTHLASCPRCRERWQALRAVDHVLRDVTCQAPAPGFTARLTSRLARREKQRAWIGASVLAAGAVGVCVVIVHLVDWQLPALYDVLQAAPAYLCSTLMFIAQWWVFLHALNVTRQTLIELISPWGPMLALGYAWLSVALALTWSGVAWQFIHPLSSLPGVRQVSKAKARDPRDRR